MQVQSEVLAGRLAALEVLALTGLMVGLGALTKGLPDPDQSRIRGLLESVRLGIGQRCDQLGLSEQATLAAKAGGDELLSQVLENLDVWR